MPIIKPQYLHLNITQTRSLVQQSELAPNVNCATKHGLVWRVENSLMIELLVEIKTSIHHFLRNVTNRIVEVEFAEV